VHASLAGKGNGNRATAARRIDPAEPIDRMEPVEAMLRMEPGDAAERDDRDAIPITASWQHGAHR